VQERERERETGEEFAEKSVNGGKKQSIVIESVFRGLGVWKFCVAGGTLLLPAPVLKRLKAA